MVKLFLLFSGVVSFLYFLKPQYFSPIQASGEKVLGIRTINQAVNIETVKTALNIYCINKQGLPNKLNQLYENELSKDKYLDLDAYFSYSPKMGCEFNLTPR